MTPDDSPPSARGGAPAAQDARVGNVAVVDIGSNSMRLVVFDRLHRAPFPVFNERVFCGLGKNLAETGELHPEGVRLAKTNMLRFARLVEAMGVQRFDILATAAVREADNGAAFVAAIEQIAGTPVTVLSGEAEARLAGMGVVAGWPEATGVMGDLGGGSLELVRLDHGAIRDAVTLPLGPLRLGATADESRDAAIEIIDSHLDEVSWLSEAGGTFHPVGGAWRALAKLNMAQHDYPLHIIHGYTLSRRQARDMTSVVARLGPRSLGQIKGVPKKRLDTLPYAALLMSRVLKRQQPAQVTFSAFGLREGHIHDLLDPATQALDPLLTAASELAHTEGRFGDLGRDLLAFAEPLFDDETRDERRLRQAAGHLADIAWREHPDYRAVQAMYRTLRLPLFAVDHSERAFLAMAGFIRYGGKPESEKAGTPRELMDERQRHRAQIIGLAHRLAITVCGGTPAILRRSALSVADGNIHVKLPDDGSAAPGDVMERRLKALAKAVGLRQGTIG
jgi:exopolyphosphatase/guanosine-5'-triphosphate,3'-diphosphate pyrophosphatase